MSRLPREVAGLRLGDPRLTQERRASERRMERMGNMREKEAKAGVAHEASSGREGGTVRPDRSTGEREPRGCAGENETPGKKCARKCRPRAAAWLFSVSKNLVARR